VVASLAESSRNAWITGYLARSVADCDAAVALGRELHHPDSLAFAWLFHGWNHGYRDDWKVCLASAESGIAIASEAGAVQTLAWNRCVRGWALGHVGAFDAGVAELTAGIDAIQAITTWEAQDPDRPWLVWLIALLEPLSDLAMHEALRGLSLPRRDIDTVLAARVARHTIPRLATRPQLSPAETSRLLPGQRVEVLLFLLAKTTAAAAKQQIVAYLETYRYVKPHLSGHDLRAMGLTPGPRFRTLLNRVLEARLNGEVTNAIEERALVQRLM
jgi:hypothetical protein